jgi:hypothetical protein
LFFCLLPCCSAWLQVQLEHMKNSTSSTNSKSSKYTKGTTRITNSTRATRRTRETRTTTTAKEEHNRSCLCIPLGGEALRPRLHAPLQLFLGCCCALSFLPFLVSLRWCTV